jgi:hypothetical protein
MKPIYNEFYVISKKIPPGNKFSLNGMKNSYMVNCLSPVLVAFLKDAIRHNLSYDHHLDYVLGRNQTDKNSMALGIHLRHVLNFAVNHLFVKLK